MSDVAKLASSAGVEVPTDLGDLAGAAAGAAGVEVPTDLGNLVDAASGAAGAAGL